MTERDPRKRISENPNSSTIYNAKQRIENETLTRPPGRSDNQPARFQQKVVQDERLSRPPGRWNERPSRFSEKDEKFSRNFQDSIRGRNSRGRPFPRHSYDNNPRFRSNQRNSPIMFKNRPQFHNERNQSLGRDDPNAKRKRSQSPVHHTARQMPKRRYSCYQPRENEEQMNSERFSRQISTENDKPSTDNRACSSKNDVLDKPTASNNETKVLRKNDDLFKKIDNLQSVADKNKTDKKESESVPINLAEAIKKIQSIKIPKLGANKNTSKTDPKINNIDPKSKDIGSKTSLDVKKGNASRIQKIQDKEPVPEKEHKKDNEISRVVQGSSKISKIQISVSKEQENSIKDEKNKPKMVKNSKIQVKSLENKTSADQIKLNNSETKTEPAVTPQVDKHKTLQCDSKLPDAKVQETKTSDTVDNKSVPMDTSNIEIEDANMKALKSKKTTQKADEIESSKVGSNVDKIESMDTTTKSSKVEENNSKPGEKPVEPIDVKNLDKFQNKSNNPKAKKLMDTNPTKNEASANKNNEAVDAFESTSATSIDANKIDEQKSNNEQNKATTSNATGKVPKVGVLTNLLENEAEDPEKVLEGLISVLGAEKMKKMQELLLKNTIKDTKCEENLDSDAEKVEGQQDEKQKVISKENKSEIIHKSSIEAESEHDGKNIKDVEETTKTEPIQSISSKSENSTTTNKSPAKTKASPNSSPEKKKKKPRKKKLTELDRLHENILSSIDCEGIMRACTQARVSIKTKTFDVSTSVNKNIETKPCTVKVLRLNLIADDMPIMLNDEFYEKYLTIQDTKSRTKPQKRRTISQEKPILKVPKLEPEIKPEPISSTLVKVEEKVEALPVEKIPEPVQEVKEIKIDSDQKIESQVKSNAILKKKKRKMLAWSKGILKKKPKRFKLGSIYDWEDVDSSDESINYETTMKLKTFKNLLNSFAKKCGYKKISKARPILEASDQKVENSVQNDLNALSALDKTENIEKSASNEDDSKFAVPKRINLPLEKNFLTMISKNPSSDVKLPITNAESSNLKITIKLPTVETSVQSSSSSIQQTQQLDALVAGPSNETNTKIYSSQNNPQKVVIVKPLSKETQNESIRVRSLSAQEQQALKEAISNTKIQPPASSIAQQSNEIIKNMLTNLNSSLYITKISSQKSTKASTSKDEPIKKNLTKISNVETVSPKAAVRSLPTISNVETISPKPAGTKENSTKEQNRMPKIVSIKSNASTAVPKIQEAIAPSSSNTKVPATLSTSKDESTLNLPETIEAINTKNNPEEIVDLIDDDDDDVVDIMRPWIEKTDFKSQKDQFEAIKMINNVYCLASLYKCMGSSCSYFTNDKSLFEKHLELHRRHQKTDSQNYLLCCYCSFRSKTVNVLPVHIENAHAYGKYG